MTTFNLNLPDSIQRHLQEMAELDGVSMDQFIASAVAEKMSVLTATNDLRNRASRGDSVAFRAILDRVPNRPPISGDE